MTPSIYSQVYEFVENNKNKTIEELQEEIKKFYYGVEEALGYLEEIYKKVNKIK